MLLQFQRRVFLLCCWTSGMPDLGTASELAATRAAPSIPTSVRLNSTTMVKWHRRDVIAACTHPHLWPTTMVKWHRQDGIPACTHPHLWPTTMVKWRRQDGIAACTHPHLWPICKAITDIKAEHVTLKASKSCQTDHVTHLYHFSNISYSLAQLDQDLHVSPHRWAQHQNKDLL